ncbi:LuxR C-terminal-related transcriptional regulator [Streptomyces sp. NPDC127039]|uniref:helix-turn-helix transcriptional regulator n=1 Tax=Streptomyces sp. NPDC127039 TaxID=3347115 RepID=UPI00366689B5
MDELYGQLRSAVARLSGLTEALDGAAPAVGRGAPRTATAEQIDGVFATVAGSARLELLEVRPEVRCDRGPGGPRSGVRHRAIVDSGVAHAARGALGTVAEIRTAALLPVRVAIADRDVLALAVGLTDTTGWLVTDRHTDAAARTAVRFADSWWPRAHRYAPVAAAESGTEAAVIDGLLQGLTDESVALRLGVTPRTVRRHVAAVSARLGAVSRFQLGVLIGQRAARGGSPAVAGAAATAPVAPEPDAVGHG